MAAKMKDNIESRQAHIRNLRVIRFICLAGREAERLEGAEVMIRSIDHILDLYDQNEGAMKEWPLDQRLLAYAHTLRPDDVDNVADDLEIASAVVRDYQIFAVESGALDDDRLGARTDVSTS